MPVPGGAPPGAGDHAPFRSRAAAARVAGHAILHPRRPRPRRHPADGRACRAARPRTHDADARRDAAGAAWLAPRRAFAGRPRAAAAPHPVRPAQAGGGLSGMEDGAGFSRHGEREGLMASTAKRPIVKRTTAPPSVLVMVATRKGAW